MPPREDDLSISNDERLWRRIIPDWITQTPEGKHRASSAAFLDGRSNEVSVHIASLTDQEKVLEGRPNDSIVEIKAGVPRSLNHAVVRDPTDKDPSHALICPPLDKPNNQRKKDARKMAEQAQWVVLQKTPLE